MDGAFDLGRPSAPRCPRAAARFEVEPPKQRGRGSPSRPSTAGDHLWDSGAILRQSLSCSVSTGTICLSVWATAEWQVPSENMAANVNARQARGLRGDCSCPSLFPTSSVTAKRQTLRPWAPRKNLLADISAFCHTAEREADGLTEAENTRRVSPTQVWWTGVPGNTI